MLGRGQRRREEEASRGEERREPITSKPISSAPIHNPNNVSRTAPVHRPHKVFPGCVEWQRARRGRVCVWSPDQGTDYDCWCVWREDVRGACTTQTRHARCSPEASCPQTSPSLSLCIPPTAGIILNSSTKLSPSTWTWSPSFTVMATPDKSLLVMGIVDGTGALTGGEQKQQHTVLCKRCSMTRVIPPHHSHSRQHHCCSLC